VPSPRNVLTLCLLLLAAGLVLGQPCAASQLLAVAASAADTALSGATVAQPKTPTAALFANPAALALFDETTADGTAAIASARTEVDASLPPTYADDNSFLVVAPGFGLAVPTKGGWYWGLGGYGAVGNKFDFEADPAAGVNHGFFSEAGVFTAVGALAYRFNDRLSMGAAVTPLFGLLRMRFALQGLPFRYTLTGPGIQGMFGVRWEPRAGLALGLGARTPGRVWMEGSMPLGPTRQDVDLELEMPAQVFAGITKRLGERTAVSVAARWSDTSSFGNSLIEFERTSQVSLPFVPGASDEWLVSVGVEYAWSDLLTLRAGGSHANGIVGTKGVSPLLFDGDDYRVGGGFGLNFDAWSVDFMAGHAFEATRRVAAREAVVFPGRYSIDGQVVMLGVTWRR